jgi:epimerase transport system membrane fusion protein
MSEPVIKKEHWVRTMRRYSEALDKLSAMISPARPESADKPEYSARMPIQVGLWMIVAVFGAFGLWAGFAPLDSAALAQGYVVLDSNRKSVQHLEGGIVEEILVKEGSHVEAGQPLVKMNPTATEARVDLFKNQYYGYRAIEARLFAERDGKEKIEFPKEVLDKKSDPVVKEQIENQEQQFKTRRDSINGQVGILRQKAEQSKKEIEGLEAQVRSADDQIKYLNEEIKTVQILLSQGNAQKPRLLALQRTKAQLEGQRGENKASIARAEQMIAESELAVQNQLNDFQTKVATELKDTQMQVSDLQERVRASEDVKSRIVITSPVRGIVTGLNVHTVGGVVNPGGKITDIVPIGEKLIVEAKVNPQDIDSVHKGLEARVRLTAYKSRNVPPVMGVVENISPDRFTDERTGISYFVARIEINPKQIENLKGVELSAGMPADVMIVTGARTLLGYILSPIGDSFRQAFREQ